MSGTIKREADFPFVSVATMVKAVLSQAEIIHGVLQHVTPQVQAVVAQLAKMPVTNIFTTGCGDSYFAPVATRLAFEKYSGCRTEAIESLELSRYTVDYLPAGSVVVGVSSGGDKSRTVEAVQEANRVGAVTVAVTGNLDSPLAREATYKIVQNERAFRIPAPPGERTTGLGNYHASLVTLYLLALELGRQGSIIDDTGYEDLVAQIKRSADIITATVEANEARIRDYARSVKDADAYYILGGGPSHATAMFSAAKLFEQPQVQGVPVELEEWAHLQYFLTRRGSQVMVFVPPGDSVDRAREQMMGAKDMGADVVAICDQDDAETLALADLSFPVLGELPEEFSPLTYCIPGELFATYVSAALGKPASRWFNWKQHEVNIRQISQSQLRSSD